MQDLFLSLLKEQPSARIFYGGSMLDGLPPRTPIKDPAPKKKLMLEGEEIEGFTLRAPNPDERPPRDRRPPIPKMLKRDEDKGLTLSSGAGYEISPEENHFIVTYREQTTMVENQNLIDEHVAYLRKLMDQGKLIMAGAYASGNQGMMVISASSLEDVAAIVQADPIFKTGCYTKADIDGIFLQLK
ncbi:YciI family protein [Bacillus pseudomycoides]|uniref:YciI family protein n=1 Tax=Bacillus bingmayongensis TaxID=1150157 RepID=A0ABU5JYV1_9BACI|nr:YciI family protein [Bacillus pseudomycoides]